MKNLKNFSFLSNLEKMSKIQLINDVLSPHFKSEEPNLAEESTSMSIELVKDRCTSIVFKLDKQLSSEYKGGIFPFFDRTKSKVCKVCDYIIFAEFKNTLFALIIELKKGNQDTGPQLKAGECFAQFVIATVNRVNNSNYQLEMRKVSIKEYRRKRKTKIRDIEYDSKGHHVFDQQKLRVVSFLK